MKQKAKRQEMLRVRVSRGYTYWKHNTPYRGGQEVEVSLEEYEGQRYKFQLVEKETGTRASEGNKMVGGGKGTKKGKSGEEEEKDEDESESEGK